MHQTAPSKIAQKAAIKRHRDADQWPPERAPRIRSKRDRSRLGATESGMKKAADNASSTNNMTPVIFGDMGVAA